MHVDCVDQPKLNGLDIDERKEYVRLNVESYLVKSIEKLNFKAHINHVKLQKVPISDTVVKELEDTCKSAFEEETKKLEKKCGFKLQSIIGIILFACADCRVEIGYAISTLSIQMFQFSFNKTF